MPVENNVIVHWLTPRKLEVILAPFHMAYITNQDIIDRVGTAAAAQLTTDSGSSPDSAILGNIAVAACKEVDRWLSRRIAVPVDTSADDDRAAALKALTLDVAEYRIHARQPPISDVVQKMYDDAVAWLKAFAEGKANLPGVGAPESQTVDAPVVEYDFQREDAGAEEMV